MRSAPRRAAEPWRNAAGKPHTACTSTRHVRTAPPWARGSAPRRPQRGRLAHPRRVTISIAVTLHCDSRRVPGCEWSYPLGADPAPDAIAARRRDADELGWTAVHVNGAMGHLCPVCNGARLAGADVRPLPTEPAALPRTIGEAAERAPAGHTPLARPHTLGARCARR